MIKKISLFLAVIMLLSLFALPVQGEETITDLTKIYNNLKTYLYVPDYEGSEYYPAYDSLMQEIKAFLASDTITQAEITKYYYDLKVAYSNLMRDVFDYSSLEGLVEAFNQLDPSLFTPESFKKVQSVYDAVREELAAPTLFARGKKTTSEMYREHTEKHIESFSGNFTNAFNGLVLARKPASATAKYVADYAKYVRFCSRVELLGDTEHWAKLESALSTAQRLGATGGSRNQLEIALQSVHDSYKAACDAALDFSEANKTLDTYKDLRAENFTVPTWTRYNQTISDLQVSLSLPHFFFIPPQADKETCQKIAKDYLDSVPLLANEKYEELISVESYQKLTTLCKENENMTVKEGLEIKLNQLQKKIEAGKQVLKNEESTSFDVKEATTNIEEALDALSFAEKHLLEEQENKVSHSPRTVKYTLIFSLSSLALAAVVAMILSRYYTGKVNWTK